MRRRTLSRTAIALGLALAALVSGGTRQPLSAQTAPRCDFYASPSGKGDGTSRERPFLVARFWLQAKPSTTLCLMDGTYRDADSMINPPSALSGIPGSPITVRALHDGKALIDGEGKRPPVRLLRNDWLVVEGLNACCSSATVVGLDHSSHDVVRRVAAWDAAEGNNDIYGVHYGEHNLLEDVAGWGLARKIFESSQDGNFTTIRRAWGRWEGSHVIGPKMVYTLAYNNSGMLVENAMGTWSGEKMKENYVLLDYQGKPWTGKGAGTHSNHDVDQPYAIFGVDQLKAGRKAGARLLGSIAYITASDSFEAPRLVFFTKIDGVEIADTVAYVGGGANSEAKTFGLYGLAGRIPGLTGAGASLLARNITSLGGEGAAIARDWETRNVLEGASPAIYGPRESLFNATRGANLCRRYVDGAVTNEPLWPWPMNQRIIDAMRQSGRRPVDVTATMEALFGPIPAPCRSDAEPTRSSANRP